MKKIFYLVATLMGLLFIILGCAPGPPPPPPFVGSISVFLMGWILIGLIVLIIVLLWKKDKSTSGKTTYITDAINDINERLKTLEEKIEKLNRNDKRN